MRIKAVETTAAAYIAWSAVGTAIAISEDEPVAFAGWNLSTGNVTTDFLVGAGTGLSAPLGMLALFAVTVLATRAKGRVGRTALRLVAVMGLCFAAGQAAEPITRRTFRSPTRCPLRTAVLVGNLTIPAGMSAAAIRRLRDHP